VAHNFWPSANKPVVLRGGLILVIFSNANRYRTRLGTDVETDAASGTAGAAICNRVIALAVQQLALHQDPRRARRNAKGASLAQMAGDHYIAAIGIAHDILQNF